MTRTSPPHLTVLFLSSKQSALVLEVQRMRSSKPSIQKLYTSRRGSHKSLLSRDGCPEWTHTSQVPFGGFAARLTEMEQNFSALTARMCKIETNAASASGVAGSARSWPSPGQVDGSTVARHHDPGSSEEGRNTRRRLGKDTSPDDESAPSAVLSRFLCEQCHAGVSAWLKKTLVPTDLPEGIHCKAGTTSARLVPETRARCQEFVARFKDDGLPCSVCSPFCNTPRARFLLVHLDHHNGERSVDGLHRSGKFVATKLREIFPEHDIEGTDIVPAIDFRAQFINMFDRRYGSEDTNRCLA